MRRIKLVVAYDGTNYHGWQIQPSSATIEGEVNKALEALTGEKIAVIGASRTDAGVHAEGNVCVFDTESSIPGERFYLALNTKLPEDIRIVSSEEVEKDFHPRYDCHNKTYEYRIYNGKLMMPNHRLYAHHCSESLDIARMNEASKALIGEHDFTSYCAAETIVEDKVRTIYDITVRREGEDVIISVTGNGFLYNMVRIIAGTLIVIGTGRKNEDFAKEALDAHNRIAAGPTAPAKGLILKEIRYL